MKCTIAKQTNWRARILLVGLFQACATPQQSTIPTAPKASQGFQADAGAILATAQQALNTPNAITIGYLQTSLGGKKNLTYIPSELHVTVGDKVGWYSTDGKFELKFIPTNNAPDWPFDEPPGLISGGGPPSSATRTVSGKAKRGVVYHFSVTLTLPGGEVLQDYECPPIVVN